MNSLPNNANDLVRTIKKAAVDAVNAQNPTTLVFGKVLGVNPLQIQIEQKITLDDKQIIRTKHVTINTGDILVLLRMQGGQQYLILAELA